MDDRSLTLDVSILGREYRVACKESEREELLQAVQFLDHRMRSVPATFPESRISRIRWSRNCTACSNSSRSERTELLEAVAYLDRRMREIRDAGKVSGTDRIAVMAALNIAHEVLRARDGTPATGGFDSAAIQRRISAMQIAIDRAMAEQEKLF